MHRRRFLTSFSATAGALLMNPLGWVPQRQEPAIMTVSGPLAPRELGFTLIHEHILVDFIGAEKVSPQRYDQEEVFEQVLPFLRELKKTGGRSLVDCTPQYLGRDAALLKRFSKASGLHILTNTGYYGAAGGKYLPAHAFEEEAGQLAERWIDEWKNGIGKSGVYPGFIKTGVDEGPIAPVDRKLLTAAARTHLETGLTISAHTGDGKAALEELDILRENRVAAEAFRWVHAQNEKDKQIHLQAAERGAWIEFDGVAPERVGEHVEFVLFMKEQGFLDQTLISHDAGWYSAGEAGGGSFRPFTTVFDEFIPALKKEGVTDTEVKQLFLENPAKSLTIKVRKAN